MEKQKGFTIYELIVVIGIMAILSAIAVPNMLSWRLEAKLRSASNTIRGDLQLAKRRALKESTIIAVIFTTNGYNIFTDNGAGANSGNWNLDADEVVVKNRQLPAGITIKLPTSFDSPNNRTRFNGRGLPDPLTLTGSGLTGTVTIKDSRGTEKQITINRLGRLNDL